MTEFERRYAFLHHAVYSQRLKPQHVVRAKLWMKTLDQAIAELSSLSRLDIFNTTRVQAAKDIVKIQVSQIREDWDYPRIKADHTPLIQRMLKELSDATQTSRASSQYARILSVSYTHLTLPTKA